MNEYKRKWNPTQIYGCSLEAKDKRATIHLKILRSFIVYLLNKSEAFQLIIVFHIYLLYVTDMVPAPDRSDACDSDLLRRLDDSERHYDWKVMYGSRSQTITLCRRQAPS